MDDEKRLIAQEAPHLRRFAVALTRDTDRADDLVQDTLERALRKHRSWRHTGSLRSWLFKILYRTYLNGQERRRLERDSAEQLKRDASTTTPANQDGRVEVLNVAAAIEYLPADQREVVLLCGLEGLSYDEAAYVTGVRVGTVKSRLYRGREALYALRHGEGARDLRRAR